MAEQQPWYTIDNIEEVDSPAFVVYPDRVKKNIELIKSMIDDVSRLRPHIKTHKTKEILHLLMDAGIHKFKCATIAEANILGAVEAKDVLLAYQPVGPKLKRFISLIQNYPATKFSCLVDNDASAKDIATAASLEEIVIPVFIDLNVGMNRTGILPEKAIELYETCSLLKGIQPVGLHAYDGHVHDDDLQLRTQQAGEIYEQVKSLQDALVRKGFREPVVVAGGSPSFPVYAKKEKIECSPGTFVFWDASYLHAFHEQAFLPAALLITRVISHPDEKTICTDLGHKSVAAENTLQNRVRFLNADLQLIGQSEEHLTATAKDHPHPIGEVLYGMPYHVCPTCALYEKALVIENGKACGEWKIAARDRTINF